MAQLENLHMDIPLLPDIVEESEILLTDKLFSKAYNHFEICVIMSGIYSILKVVFAPIFLAIAE